MGGRVHSAPMVDEVMAAVDVVAAAAFTGPDDLVFSARFGGTSAAGDCTRASARRSMPPPCRASASTTCATASRRRRPEAAVDDPFRATSGTRTWRPRCAACTTRRRRVTSRC